MAEEDTNNSIFGTVKNLLGFDDKKAANPDNTESAGTTSEEAHDKTEAPAGGVTATITNTAAAAATTVTATATAVADSILSGGKTEPDGTAEKAEAGGEEEAAKEDVKSDGDNAGETSGASASADKDTDAKDAEADKPKTGGDSGKPRENPTSIPTAGGKKLGEEHWGESKIVPDVPKTAEEQKEDAAPGVSSAEGQPTEEVKNNTSANTGGAASGPQTPVAAPSPAKSTTTSTAEGEKKGKFLERIKSKLKKDKSPKA